MSTEPWWRRAGAAVARAARADDRRGDVVTAAVTFLLGVLTLVVGLVGLYRDAPQVPLWWHAVLLAAGCLLVVVKRRSPVRALLGGVVLVVVDLWWGGSVALVLVLWDLLHAAALWSGEAARRALWTVATGLVVVAAVVAVVATGDPRELVFTALQLGAVLLTPLWWATDVRRKSDMARLERQRADLAGERAHLAEQQAELERQRARDLERLAEAERHEAVRAERAAMARDLHDVVAAHLSTIAIHSGAALASPPDAARDRAALEQVRAASVASLEEMRSMILLLRSEPRAAGASGDDVAAPPRLTGPGALDSLVGRATAAGTAVRVEGADDVVAATLPVAVDQALHRIAAEALTNAVKHAPGAPAVLRLARPGTDVELEVRNAAPDGAPPQGEAALSGGTGLLGMRERAEALGGGLVAGPAADGGWSVRARIPLRVPAGRAAS
ncbi:two-component sensor histidine kinase [Xylanimonas oleitrophica]|uniref:histidine kinase n=1 Tax=Xylanimonas oleitrophica TaxID=2607479 RepID=A0A2W5WWE5_9MICO|nr:histidine kinase [Xylanimonas oleitrophica]PZR52155.1 two-component sensor histidine kinase [Xylanimonas oleitrophica]